MKSELVNRVQGLRINKDTEDREDKGVVTSITS